MVQATSEEVHEKKIPTVFFLNRRSEKQQVNYNIDNWKSIWAMEFCSGLQGRTWQCHKEDGKEQNTKNALQSMLGQVEETEAEKNTNESGYNFELF